MPKNKGLGGKHFRSGTKKKTEDSIFIKKEQGQEYAKITKVLGDRNFEAYCSDGITRLCHVRGKLRGKTFIFLGDIVLISLRDFQDNKADIISKYSNDHINILKNEGDINFENTKSEIENNMESIFSFDEI